MTVGGVERGEPVEIHEQQAGPAPGLLSVSTARPRHAALVSTPVVASTVAARSGWCSRSTGPATVGLIGVPLLPTGEARGVGMNHARGLQSPLTFTSGVIHAACRRDNEAARGFGIQRGDEVRCQPAHAGHA